MNQRELARFIDHTLLKPTATQAEIEQIAREALEYQFRTICIESRWLKTVEPLLKGSNVLPITVISFPGGDAPTEAKVREAIASRELGAREIDMVLNRNLLKSYRYTEVELDISRVVTAVDVPVKVILETCELTDNQKTVASALSRAAGAQFVKTSTGFSRSGATASDIRLMRETVGPEMGVKASGGIRTLKDALLMIESGATRLGLSASVAILKELSGDGPVTGPGGY